MASWVSAVYGGGGAGLAGPGEAVSAMPRHVGAGLAVMGAVSAIGRGLAYGGCGGLGVALTGCMALLGAFTGGLWLACFCYGFVTSNMACFCYGCCCSPSLRVGAEQLNRKWLLPRVARLS